MLKQTVPSDAAKHVFEKRKDKTTTGLMSTMKKSSNYLKKRKILQSYIILGIKYDRSKMIGFREKLKKQKNTVKRKNTVNSMLH